MGTPTKNSPLTVKLGNPLVGLPVYGNNCVLNGLAFCIHGYQGVRIYVTEYTIDDSGAYSGTLQYTFFDHFGLDRNDISNYDNAGFESWYILQHHEKFSGSYKPFVTYIEFEHEFSGTIS